MHFSGIISFLRKNYQSFLIGGAIMLGIILLVVDTGANFSVIHPEIASRPLYLLSNILALIFCWLLLSFLLIKFPLKHILGVMSILVISILAERFLPIAKNPLTIPLLILFWLGVAAMILPQFFKKYQVAILLVYGLVISYYLFSFLRAQDYSNEDRGDFANIMLIPVPAFLLLWVYEQWRWLRMLQTDKAKAELNLLKNQINPHFFFNTLNNLYGLAVEKSDQTPDMILKLADMMRYTIYEGEADFVPLKNESSYLKDYIALHKIRYQKSVAISFEQSIDHQHQIAPLLLVVPLENAFKHGVESLTENAYVHIQVSTSPHAISFRISNNFAPKAGQKAGIGLSNLRQRLALLYPRRHQLNITQSENVYTVQLEIDVHEVSDH
ncbi:MAG: sensor histidine kinase [Bacteroidota bacterium]